MLIETSFSLLQIGKSCFFGSFSQSLEAYRKLNQKPLKYMPSSVYPTVLHSDQTIQVSKKFLQLKLIKWQCVVTATFLCYADVYFTVNFINIQSWGLFEHYHGSTEIEGSGGQMDTASKGLLHVPMLSYQSVGKPLGRAYKTYQGLGSLNDYKVDTVCSDIAVNINRFFLLISALKRKLIWYKMFHL